ncbi:barstar family protein [Rouxiella badensis]|jgi:ribonuclease inhibitor|uniref:Barstar (barnase inhibitor) domain-containing protein n=1 Tax=Rouxiella badensis TaxID=1646377 RepID=A0A1X0WJU4_9GAMM|nr:barstar family protein [Rouxiella badensis]MCC3702461.1 barstar family protein [Rouxiella badensis]MCC3718644.1 barstar family protein [Rouxiella badensis]MCC3728017.1 barstar family protein [Rouxiella badensis]MCC3732815.1 barstar family protein [Rouxiella badensis]MCC3739761.1 barstar family protein [Rouxiella badensis]
MKKVVFDFNHIPDLAAFYADFSRQFTLSEQFGANLDALWDEVTGGIALPVEIDFTNLNAGRKRRFGSLVLLFEEAEEELDGALRFNLFEKAKPKA